MNDNLGPEDSSALRLQSEHYPPNYRGRVPLKIKMACDVLPDYPYCPGTKAEKDAVYPCWVNSHGAVSAICDNGKRLGVKSSEFDVVEWHPQNQGGA